MHQNAQICKLNFQIFLVGYAPRPTCWGGATAPLPRPGLPRRFAPTARIHCSYLTITHTSLIKISSLVCYIKMRTRHISQLLH